MLKNHLPEYALLSFTFGCAGALIVLRLLMARALLSWLPSWLPISRQHVEAPIPRTGGFAIVTGIAVVAVIGWLRGAHLAAPSATTGLLVGMGGMFTAGLIHDFWPRLGNYCYLAQFLVALAAIASGLRMDYFHLPIVGAIILSPLVATVVTALWLVLCTNVIGLVNGIEGLAGGISLMVLGLTFDVAHASGDAGVALFIAGMAGGLVSFLWYNFPPARIALGKNGTYVLGMALGGLSIEVSHKGALQFAFLAPTLAMGLPFLDMGMILARRLMRGIPIFRANRHQIHHQLQEQGLDPVQTLMVLYGVSACFLTAGFVVMWTKGQLVPLVLALVGVLVLLFLRQLSLDGRGISNDRSQENRAVFRREIKNAEVMGKWLSLQSTRVSNFDEFWTRFCYVIKDLGLTGAELQANGLDRYFSSGLPTGDGLSSRHRILGPGGVPIQILIRGDSDKTHSALFYTLAELAAEALQSGLQRSRGFKLE
jgi:UDP-GlcNAc:undecaprenyl-phosphate GlcNAc-1-phosphate transferase